MKLAHAISGNIVDPLLLKTNATRIPVCRGTEVSIQTFDNTGDPFISIDAPASGGISCDSSGCVVSRVDSRVRYLARSADGRDTDRITILPE